MLVLVLGVRARKKWRLKVLIGSLEARAVKRAFLAPTVGLASSFAKASDFAKASSDKSEDNSEAALQDAFMSSGNALMMWPNALWFIFVLIAG